MIFKKGKMKEEKKRKKKKKKRKEKETLRVVPQVEDWKRKMMFCYTAIDLYLFIFSKNCYTLFFFSFPAPVFSLY